MYKIKNKLIVLIVVLIILLSIFLPAKLSQINDSAFINVIHKQEQATFPESYQYSLNIKDKLYILSMALSTRNILESDYAASLREKAIRTKRDNTVASFAYVENNIEQSDMQNAIDICNKKLKIILEDGLDIKNFDVNNKCNATLYTAVDILNPQRYVTVWQIEYDSFLPTNDSINDSLLMEAYIDSKTGDLYSFAIRTKDPVEFDAKSLATAWAKQLDIINFDDITDIANTTKQHKKYSAEGMNREKIVFSVGYHEGVNEIFVSIII